MFVWLASYPKSGNTLVRSMIAAYFFSKDGIYNFNLIKNINQFPQNNLFKKIGVDFKNENEVLKNYIKVQEFFNKKNSIQFLKTHSYLFNINNNPFTDLKNSLGAIYIVRDPRNVVTSWSNFTNTSINKATETLINSYKFGGDINNLNQADQTAVYVGTWRQNYNSWKSFKHEGRYLLIKYEDLINKTEFCFKKILEFLYNLQNIKFKIDKKKFENTIKTTSFEEMKKMEKEKGFTEGKINIFTKKKIPFFNLGPDNNWKKILEPEIRKKIEKAFKKEMIELGYL